MSVRAGADTSALNTMPQDMGAAIAEATPDGNHLAEGGSFSTATPENPLTRNLAVSIRASLNGAPAPFKNPSTPQTPSRAEPPRSRLSRALPPEEQGRLAAVAGGAQGDLPAGTAAAPPAASVTAPAQPRRPHSQKRFTALDGTSEAMGDLKSVVLHDMRVTHVKSSFPMSLGAKITAVDDRTFSSTGEAFSTIILPNSESTASKTLQADDVSLAYELQACAPRTRLLRQPRADSHAHPPQLEEVPRLHGRQPQREGVRTRCHLRRPLCPFDCALSFAASTRSRSAASCSSRPSAHACFQHSLTATTLLTALPLARSHPIVSAISENGLETLREPAPPLPRALRPISRSRLRSREQPTSSRCAIQFFRYALSAALFLTPVSPRSQMGEIAMMPEGLVYAALSTPHTHQSCILP